MKLLATASTVMLPLAAAFAPTTTTTTRECPTIISSRSSSSLLASSSSETFAQDGSPEQTKQKMSISIPFLACPKALKESKLAGNVGFDPLGFAKNQELLSEYREAEIKHARLAMLAAVGWPTSELMDRAIAEYFNAPTMLDDGDRVPSVLNGGMERISPQWWGFCVGLAGAIDVYGITKARRGGPDYTPGNLGFDPLNIYPSDKVGQQQLQLAEIKHGRIAMLGVLGYVIEEYFSKMAVIDDTPVFFQPFTETVEEALVDAIEIEQAIAGAL
jgi:hypothetical protein